MQHGCRLSLPSNPQDESSSDHSLELAGIWSECSPARRAVRFAVLGALSRPSTVSAVPTAAMRMCCHRLHTMRMRCHRLHMRETSMRCL